MDDPTKDKLVEELAEELNKALSTIQNLTWIIKEANVHDHGMKCRASSNSEFTSCSTR